VPAGARQSPQGEVRKTLLAPGIPAYPRLDRKRRDRPVTPEVAGSSPVAPVLEPASNRRVFRRSESVVVWIEHVGFSGLVEGRALGRNTGEPRLRCALLLKPVFRGEGIHPGKGAS
jgi:hypothetical protein